MVSEALEVALAEASMASDPVRALAQKKLELRPMLEELQRLQGGDSEFGLGSEEENTLEQQVYQSKRELAALKAEAAKEPAFEFLNAPVGEG